MPHAACSRQCGGGRFGLGRGICQKHYVICVVCVCNSLCGYHLLLAFFSVKDYKTMKNTKGLYEKCLHRTNVNLEFLRDMKVCERLTFLISIPQLLVVRNMPLFTLCTVV